MKIIRKIFIFAPVAVCIWLSGAQLHGQFILYGTDGSQGNPSELYILDKSDGSIGTTVGPIGFAVTGLAIHPTTGVLYGSTSNNDANFPGHLITINKETGQGTIVGDFGFIVAASVGPFGGIATQTMADLTFNPSGVLFGWLENSTDDLFTIELGSGQATLMGESGLNTFGSGLASDASGNIFFTPRGDTFAGGGLVTDDGLLLTIDRGTGLPTLAANLSGGTGLSVSINALAFDEFDNLFGVLNVANGNVPLKTLITIDTSSGNITQLGNTVSHLDAIVFEVVPEPATSVLLVIGILGILFFSKRKLLGS